MCSVIWAEVWVIEFIGFTESSECQGGGYSPPAGLSPARDCYRVSSGDPAEWRQGQAALLGLIKVGVDRLCSLGIGAWRLGQVTWDTIYSHVFPTGVDVACACRGCWCCGGCLRTGKVMGSVGLVVEWVTDVTESRDVRSVCAPCPQASQRLAHCWGLLATMLSCTVLLPRLRPQPSIV